MWHEKLDFFFVRSIEVTCVPAGVGVSRTYETTFSYSGYGGPVECLEGKGTEMTLQKKESIH